VIDKAASIVARATGSAWAFVVALTIVFGGWALDRWDIVDAIATAATFIMMFGLQRSANTNSEAVHKKLDEIVRAEPEADDSVRGIEP